MEAQMVLSVGTALSILGMFYTWHKDSKHSAAEMARLKARVETLESRAAQTDSVLQELLSSVQEIKVSLAKIDTKLTAFEQEFNRSKHN